MNYTLNQLRIFLKLVELKSITKTAEALHLTQPAVSIQLKNLQQQFSSPLFEVIGRKLYITDFGYEVAASAGIIAKEIERIDSRQQAYDGKMVGKLNISIVSTGKYIMPYFLTDFMKLNEHIVLNMTVTNKQRVLDSLTKNSVDFALVSILPDQPLVESIPLMENRLYLVGRADSSFNDVEYDNSILEDIPLIYREDGSGTRYTMDQFFLQHKIAVKKKMELTTNEAVKQAVIAGLGFSILPLIGIKNELENGTLKIINVQDFPIKSQWHLIWLKEKRFSHVARAYFDYINQDKEALMKKHFSWLHHYKQ